MPLYTPPAGDNVNFGVEAYTPPTATHVNFNLTYVPQIVLVETLSFGEGENIVIPYERLRLVDSVEVSSSQGWVKKGISGASWTNKTASSKTWTRKGGSSIDWERRKI